MNEDNMFVRYFCGTFILSLVLSGCTPAPIPRPEVITSPIVEVVVPPKIIEPKPIEPEIPPKLTLFVFETKRCKICKELNTPLRKLAKESKGRFDVKRIDASNSDVLNRNEMKPLFPAFMINGPGLSKPIRKYGRGSFEDIETWLLSGEARSSKVPLQQNLSRDVKPFEAVLVAGSSDNANFVQEVIWLKHILAEKGLADDAIACFYAMPDAVSYFVDKKQFDELSEEMRFCRPALRDDILKTVEVSLSVRPKHFFFYVSAHGHPPDKALLLKPGEKDCDARAPSLALDEGALDCDSENHLTPDALAGVIPNTIDTQKVLVFQGCYTGGFISLKDAPQRSPSSLAKIPNTILFTASKSDRPSFGCAPGTNSTIYGGSFVKAFIEDSNSFGNSDWKSVMKRTKRTVLKLEGELGITEKSQPKFFQTNHTIP